MIKEQKLQAAKACLDYNKQANEVFVTSDLTCFLERNHAVNHAFKLNDKHVDVFGRDNDEISEQSEATAETTEAANTQPNADLANQQAQGNNLEQKFEKVKAPAKSAASKDKAPKEDKEPEASKGTEGDKLLGDDPGAEGEPGVKGENEPEGEKGSEGDKSPTEGGSN